MDIKNFESTPFQDLVCTNDGDFEQENRSYTCTFCKRGFSNAQALGGHMNVHRKDRARLQESIQETLITKQSTKGMNLLDHSELQSSSDEKSDGVRKRPWTSTKENSPESPRKKDHGVNFEKPSLQLSLRVESSSTSDQSSIIANRISSLLSSPTELDLELRLGMDSQATSRDHVILD